MVCKDSKGKVEYKYDVCKLVLYNKVEDIVLYIDDVCKFVLYNKVEGKVVYKNEVCKFVRYNKVEVFKYTVGWLDKKTWDEFPEYKDVDIKVEYISVIMVFEFLFGKVEYNIVVSLSLIGKSDKSENESVIVILS